MTALPQQDEYAHFFEVRLDLFDGPIDLLLHLVKQNELPIERVSLAQVSDQYMACLDRMRGFDLDIAAEYLVIAATLVSVKASVLLNEPPELVPDEEGNLVDPHEELLKRLREAQIYREAAHHIHGLKVLNVDVFPPAGALADVQAPPAELKPHDAMLLGKLFRKLLLQLDRNEVLLEISVDSVTIVQRMMNVVESLKGSGDRRSFRDLFPDVRTREALVSSILALLELCKRRVIMLSQSECFEEIYVALAVDDERAAAPDDRAAVPTESEFQPAANDSSASNSSGTEVRPAAEG